MTNPVEAADAITPTGRPRLNPALARQRNVILASLLAVAAVAWIAVVQQVGGEDEMTMSGLDLTDGMGAWAFIGMWSLMMVGMMFPASAPMILTFSTIQARRRAAGRPYVPTSLFTMSYVLVWVIFGVVALGLAAGMGTLAEHSDWLTANWSRIAGALLVAAGIYQLTPLKRICLRKCRTPLGFLLEHWRDGRSGAFAMGVNHGLYCAGCCWLLFVILVALGVMNLPVMAAVAAVVFGEKTLPRGEWIARVAGVGLIAYGAFALFVPEALPGEM